MQPKLGAIDQNDDTGFQNCAQMKNTKTTWALSQMPSAHPSPSAKVTNRVWPVLSLGLVLGDDAVDPSFSLRCALGVITGIGAVSWKQRIGKLLCDNNA